MLTDYCNRIMFSLDEINKVVESMQRAGYEIYVADGSAQLVDEVIRLRKLYKIDKEECVKHGNCKIR